MWVKAYIYRDLRRYPGDYSDSAHAARFNEDCRRAKQASNEYHAEQLAYEKASRGTKERMDYLNSNFNHLRTSNARGFYKMLHALQDDAHSARTAAQRTGDMRAQCLATYGHCLTPTGVAKHQAKIDECRAAVETWSQKERLLANKVREAHNRDAEDGQAGTKYRSFV